MIDIEKNNVDIPVWERYTMTFEEVSKYFCIGEKKYENWKKKKSVSWIKMNGNRIQIKRKQF